MQTHRAHPLVHSWWGGRPVALTGRALVETYSVLTRLPGDVRLDPGDAARLLNKRFEPPILLPPDAATRLPQTFADLGVFGGAEYDAIVATAAAAQGVTVATRDARAKSTYDAVGVVVELVV